MTGRQTQSNSAPHAMQARDVEVRIGRRTILKDVSFSLQPGQVLALVGPNGAGKTTLLGALAGLVRIHSGTIHVDGQSILHAPRSAQVRIGILSDRFGVDPELSVRESLYHTAWSQGLRRKPRSEQVDWALDRCGLHELADTRCNVLSRGQQQWLGLAQAIVHRPRYLLLDEPSSGMDPIAREGLAERLRELASDQKAALLVSSHLLDELATYANALIVLHQGRLKAHHPQIEPTREALLSAYATATAEEPIHDAQ